MKQKKRFIKGVRFFGQFITQFPLSTAFKLIVLNGLRYAKITPKQDCSIVRIRLKNKKESLSLRPCTSDSVIFNQIFIEKQYDIASTKNCKTIIDCGANIGLSCIYFKMNNPEATIVAIEPEKHNFELLKNNLKEYENIYPIQAGIWSKNCHLQIEDLNVPSSSFRMQELEKASDSSIPAITISQIIKDFNLKSVDLLKIDIEGSETELFSQNFEEWIPYVKVLIIELHDWMKKGCTDTFFSALSHYKYTKCTLGENIVIEFDHK